jgi:uncharacterized protein
MITLYRFLILCLVIFVTSCSDYITEGDHKMLQALTEKGQTLSIKDAEIIERFCTSAAEGYLQSVSYLVNAGMDVNTTCGKSQSPVLIMSLGMTAGPDVGGTAIYLIEHGANVNQTLIKTGYTPLMEATFYARLEAVRLLLKKHANPNAQDVDGYTALMEFNSQYSPQELDIASLLIQYGADVNIKAKDGMTALKKASSLGKKDIMELLKKHGAKE